MDNNTVQRIKPVEEHEASPEVAEIYARIKQDFQVPNVPNWAKLLGVSPAALKMYHGMLSAFYEHMSLPHSLVAMICFTIAERSNCTYCAALNELTCRTLGVDEASLTAMANDLTELNPERVRAMIEFALKVAKHPQDMTSTDFDSMRAHGISDAEIVEIALVAGMGLLNDALADAIHIDVDEDVAEALAK